MKASWSSPTLVGIRPRKKAPPFAEYRKAVQVTCGLKQASQWGLGDLYNLGQLWYGDKMAEPWDVEHTDLKTVQNYASVCKAFEYSRRREKLDFGHHEVLSSLTVRQQEHWLNQAERLSLSVRDLRKMTAKERGRNIDEETGALPALVKWYEKGIELVRELEPSPHADFLRWAMSKIGLVLNSLKQGEPRVPEGVMIAWIPVDELPVAKQSEQVPV